VEVRVNGECALIQGGAEASPARVLNCIRAWADATGKTVGSVLLDGVEVSPEDLEAGVAGDKDPSLLEIRILDALDSPTRSLRRASSLVPGLRLDMGFASRCLREGQVRRGLEALAQAVRALGTLEAALEESAHRSGIEGVLGKLKGLLGKIHESMQAQDLHAVAILLRQDGPEVVMECDRRMRALSEGSSE
jgi:hypothetical protein